MPPKYSRIIVVSAAVLLFALPCVKAHAYTDIHISENPEPEIRFVSGKTVYVEGLVGEAWQGRYWAADGRGRFACRRLAGPAFRIEIKSDPKASVGKLILSGWRWVSAREMPKTDRGARHFVVKLSNPERSIDVAVHTLLDGTPVVTRWLEITNTSKRPVALTAISPWSGQLWCDGAAFTLGYQTRGTLGCFDWKLLTDIRTTVQSTRGNAYDDPFFVVRNEAQKEYFIGHLAWTANWRMNFNRGDGLSFDLGPIAHDALRVIEPGETVKSPAMRLGLVKGDFDTAVQAMHDHIRRSVLPTRRPELAQLVQYSVPADNGFFRGEAFDEANLLKCVDIAATLGAELFIIDFGWWDVYGEWEPSAGRFPRGIAPVFDRARKKGMRVGLYVEPEGGRGNWRMSRLYKEHPDWFDEHNVLRLERPEVASYMESELLRLIDLHKPNLYRHDFIPGYMMEGTSTLRDGFSENNYWRYYENYYAVWDRIHRKYPDLILQMCSNGGSREDLDMLGRFHESYTDEAPLWDEPDYDVNNFHMLPPMLPSYSGKTVALPPEILILGIAPSQRIHGDTDLRVMFTLGNTPWMLCGPARSVDELKPEVKDRYLHYVGIYKSFIRPMLATVRTYHHEPVNARGGVQSSPWFAMEFASPDRTKGWAVIVRNGSPDTYILKPKGLDPARIYEVTFDSLGSTVEIEGLKLIRDGLPIRLESVASSELLLFKSQSTTSKAPCPRIITQYRIAQAARDIAENSAHTPRQNR